MFCRSFVTFYQTQVLKLAINFELYTAPVENPECREDELVFFKVSIFVLLV